MTSKWQIAIPKQQKKATEVAVSVTYGSIWRMNKPLRMLSATAQVVQSRKTGRQTDRAAIYRPSIRTANLIYKQLSALSEITRGDEGARCRGVSQIKATAPLVLDLQAAAL